MGVVHRLGLAGGDQRRRQQRLAERRQQRLRDRVVGHAQADRAARRVRQSPWHLLGCLEDEGVGAGRALLEQPELAVVDAREARQLGQVAAQQRQVVLVVDFAQPAQLLGGSLVVEVAHQRVARVGRDRRYAAGVQDLRRLLQQARLRIQRVDLEVLRHGAIVAPTGPAARFGRGPRDRPARERAPQAGRPAEAGLADKKDPPRAGLGTARRQRLTRRPLAAAARSAARRC